MRCASAVGRAALAAALMATCASALGADYFSGSRLYARHCAECHGSDGRGLAAGAPDFRYDSSLMQPDTALYRTISEGSGGMPAFRGVLTREEILDVIAYMRSLQR